MAAKFRKVDPRIWTDERFRKLNPEERLLALWLLTCSRLNRVGIVLWSPALAAEETGIPRNRIDTVSGKVCATLNWVYDTRSGCILFPKWWRYNPPDNVKALIGALSDLHDVPQHDLKHYLLASCDLLKPSLRVVYTERLNTLCDTVSPQEQEQEQEKEKEKEKEQEPIAASPPAVKKQRVRCPIWDALVEITGSDSSIESVASHIGKVRKALIAAKPPYTADEILSLPTIAASRLPWAAGRTLTLGEVEKNIGIVRLDGKPVGSKSSSTSRMAGTLQQFIEAGETK